MLKGLLTPLGEIRVFTDDHPSDFSYEEYRRKSRALLERPPAGCYKILLPVKDVRRISCVVSLLDPSLPNEGASGERFLYSEFAKDNCVLTIGAEDENPAFETVRLPCGVEYIPKKDVDSVVFGVAWVTDSENRFDIRTQLAADLW